MKAWKSILFAAIFISVFLFGCASVSVYETSIGGKMIKISAGKFMMGSEKSENGHYPDEFFHEVTISKDFLIGETEVTQAQWEEVMGADPSHFTGCSDCPVEMVSWYDAIRFTNRLSEIEGFNKCYVGQGQDYSWDFSCNGYRLPTEAEWEFAARAGTTTVYSLGDCVTTDQVNFNGSSPLPDCPAGQYRGKTIPVASLAANKFGLYDIHGNVWEWVWIDGIRITPGIPKPILKARMSEIEESIEEAATITTEDWQGPRCVISIPILIKFHSLDSE